jgi:hypothetical protein
LDSSRAAQRLIGICEAAAGASAQEEIDEATGKGLRPRDDIANLQFELLVQCRRAGQVSAVTCRKPSKCKRGGDGPATGPAKAADRIRRSVLFQHSGTERPATILSAIENGLWKRQPQRAFLARPRNITDRRLLVVSFVDSLHC